MTYRWLNALSQQFLERDYLIPGQTVDQRVDVICKGISHWVGSEVAIKFKENLQKGWYSLSTPIWTNFGNERGLPISCFGSHIEDTIESILYTQAEVGVMSKYGGGTSAYFGDVRPRGSSITNNGESSGSVHFMQLFDSIVEIISQGRSRRGNFAAYLPIEHKDVREFLTIKKEGSPIQNIFSGVTITDDWMRSMIDGDREKRRIWAGVLESRANGGLPYIFFTDSVNNGAADVYREKGMKINASNLCTEINLPARHDESFVCDLSSMNILYYDEWKNTDAVEVLTYVLDAVMSEFIDKAQHITFLERAVRFAIRHRALGIGWLGWHSYLQSKMIPFESMEAKRLNVKIAKNIYTKAHAASAKLAEEYGEPEVLKGYGRRNTTLMAIAPTKSSSFILGQVSEGIEPQKTNYYVRDLQKGKYTVKNPHLLQLLLDKGIDNPKTWDSILKNGGSVQHLNELSQDEKDVFKTFAEISQKEVIIQASQRQKYLDQSQSLNLMIHPSIPTKDVNALIIEAWQLGVKNLYYQYSVNAAQNFNRNILECSSCSA